MASRDYRDRELNPLGKIAIGAAAVGVGIYAGARSGVLEAASRYLSEEARALPSAFERWRGKTPIGNDIGQLFNADIRNAEWQRFSGYFKEELQSQREAPYLFEKLFQQRKSFEDEWGRTLSGRGLNQARNFIDDSLVQRQQQTWLGSMAEKLTGLRQARVSDVLDRNLGSQSSRDWLSSIIARNGDAASAIADRGLFVNPTTGSLVDLRGIANLPQQAMQFLEPGIIGKLGHFGDILFTKNAPEVTVFRGAENGSLLQPYITGNTLPLGKSEAYLYAGGRMANLWNPDQILDGEWQLFSGRYQTMQRETRRMAPIGGLNPYNKVDMLAKLKGTGILPGQMLDKGDQFLSKVLGFLDFGGQEAPTKLENILSIFRKFKDPNWIGNISDNLFNPESIQGAERTEEQVKRLRSFLGSKTKPLGQRTFDVLTEAAGLEGYDVHNKESVIDMLKREGAKGGSSLERRLKEYNQNPDAVMSRIGVISSRYPFGRSTAIRGEDILRKELGEDLIQRIGPDKARSIIDEATIKGKLSRTEAIAAQDLISKVTYDTFYQRYLKSKKTQSDLNNLVGLFKGTENARFQDEVRRMVKRYASAFHYGPSVESAGEEIAKTTHNLGDYLVVRRGPSISRAISDLVKKNDGTKAKAFMKTLTAGRGNLQDVTSVTMFPYVAGARLAEAISNIGIPYVKGLTSGKISNMSIGVLRLGLSQQSTGSAGDIWMSLLMKRVLPAALGVGLAGYASWEVKNFTGYSIGQRFARTQAQFMLDRSNFHSDEDRREWQLKPGIDQLSALPGVGAFVNEPRNYQETIDYLRYGRDPVRKGRYWMLSRGPYSGGKIEYYAPNFYQTAMSDWKYTGTMYGQSGWGPFSGSDYWSHSWIPTPRYPLAPLNRILDPYWMERKHYNDRPYPVSGDFFEANSPWGSVLNPTVGQVIKPNIKMHRRELSQINEDIKQWANDRKKSVFGVVTASGDFTLKNLSYVGAPPGLLTSSPAEAGLWYGGGGYAGGSGNGPATGFSGGSGGYGYGGGTASSGGRRRRGATFANSGPLFISQNVIGGTSGNAASMKQLASINQQLVNQKAVPPDIMPPGSLPVGGLWTPLPQQLTSINAQYEAKNVIDPTGLGPRLSNVQYVTRELLGIYGFGSQVMTGSPYQQAWMAQKADVMYGAERRFWDKNMGGLGGMISEIGRRFLPHERHDINYWNPIPNTQPGWMPGMDYIKDFQHGDPYAQVKEGELRLPGEAYEASHQMHGDAFGKYGAFDRYRILADVAPYSDEYRMWKKIAGQTVTDKDVRSQMKTIRSETAAQKKKYRLYPYQFVGKDIVKEKVTISKFIDPNTFIASEYPNAPIRLGAVKLNSENPLSNFLSVGQTVTVGLEKDPNARVRDDTLGTMHAVIWANGMNINRMLLNRKIGKEPQYPDKSAVGLRVRFSEAEIQRGKNWEKSTHRNIPIISNKFMNVNSPLEYYERQMVYGKEWSSWEHPIRDYIRPTWESAIHHDNPLVSAGVMAITGAMIGRTIGGSWKRGLVAAGIAAVAGAAGSIWRMNRDMQGGDKWIPERRRKEREIDEYFDILKYMKYRGLYQYAVEMARQTEGVDIESLIGTPEREGKQRKLEAQKLMEQKRKLILDNKQVHKTELKDINNRLNEIQNYKQFLPVTPWTIEAMRYQGEMERTLYGGDPYGNYQDFYGALPSKDREFVQAFAAESDPEKREKILQLVPHNQRRFYQAKWGMPQDEVPNLEDYFQNHNLPGPKWAGWRPDVDLNSIKLKMVKNEGLEMSEFNMWPNDEVEAQGAPELPSMQGGSLNPFAIQSSIENILNGRGLKNVKVTMQQVSGSGIDVDFNVEHDRSDEIKSYITKNFATLMM
jgi:hypothetical protein